MLGAVIGDYDLQGPSEPVRGNRGVEPTFDRDVFDRDGAMNHELIGGHMPTSMSQQQQVRKECARAANAREWRGKYQ